MLQVTKKLKAKKRKAQAKIRPEGRQKYLPTGQLVDEIVLVGGATHMVGVRKLVANLFGVDPRRTVDPMQAVALGAAVQAGVLSGEVSGVRVLQSWQASLGRMMETAEAAKAEEAEAAKAAKAVDEEVEEESAYEATVAASRASESELGDAAAAAKEAEDAEEEAAAAAWMARVEAGQLPEEMEELEEEVEEVEIPLEVAADFGAAAAAGVDINALFRKMDKEDGGAA